MKLVRCALPKRPYLGPDLPACTAILQVDGRAAQEHLPQTSRTARPPHDRFGSKLGRPADVRCTTALPPKADVHPRSCYVAFVPRRDIAHMIAISPTRSDCHCPQSRIGNDAPCRLDDFLRERAMMGSRNAFCVPHTTRIHPSLNQEHRHEPCRWMRSPANRYEIMKFAPLPTRGRVCR
jgi:hypothetical protein